MKTVILPASIDYVEGFWRSLDIVARERRYLLFTEAPSLEKTKTFVSDLIAKGGSQFYAICNEEVVGWCDIIRHERAGMTHSGHLGIGIVPSHRGKGIAGRLLRATIDDAFTKGVERVELEVFASNQRAAKIYLDFGFVEEGRKRRARFIDDEYDDFIVMALLKETPNQALDSTSFAGIAVSEGVACCGSGRESA